MGEYIKITEDLCSASTDNIEGKIMNEGVYSDINFSDYGEYKDKKENILYSTKGELFLYKPSLLIFGFFQGNRFDKIYQEI